MPTNDLTGQKFGRWTVIGKAEHPKNSWICQCECGTVKTVQRWKLIAGRSQSCGCLHRDMLRQKYQEHPTDHKHYRNAYGDGHKRLYHIWYDMLKRCEKVGYMDYGEYGARGIAVCDSWHDYGAFRMWAYATGYDDELKLTIDRIDVNKGYSPDNCRWLTNAEQQRNKRSCVLIEYDGRTLCMAEWARELGISYDAFKRMYRDKHMQMEDIVKRVRPDWATDAS